MTLLTNTTTPSAPPSVFAATLAGVAHRPLRSWVLLELQRARIR